MMARTICSMTEIQVQPLTHLLILIPTFGTVPLLNPINPLSLSRRRLSN
jgi:hypothetical protein